jgi:dynein heavy chain
MEIINCLLSSGDVPNLFPKDEIASLCDGIRPLAKKAGVEDTPDQLFKFVIETARNNLHIVTCMSPVGDAFRTRIRMFPALCNNTTIDWFLEWPVDALEEVALKFLEDLPEEATQEGEGDKTRQGLASTCAIAHATAVTTSAEMLSSSKRYNYITPIHFLELVKGYLKVLAQKRKVVLDSSDKLKNGLQKLMDSQEQVEVMSAKMAENKIVVEQAQKECAELLVTIVQERRVADDEEKKVSAEEKIITKDKVECEKTAAECGEHLAKALPALENAEKALESLKASDIAEVKQYKQPPEEVIMVMNAIMCLRKDKGKSWDDCKKVLTDPKFLSSLKFFDKTIMDKAMTDKVKKFTDKETFKPDHIRKKSGAAAALAEWVIAMKYYGEVAQVVEPRKRKLAESEKTLAKKLKELKAAQDKLAAIQAQVALLQKQFDESNEKKTTLEAELAMLEEKLDRAQKIVSGLASERVRWGETIVTLDQQEANLVGDVLVAAAFSSYAGPFPSDFRDAMVASFLDTVREQEILHSEDFKFTNFLASPVDVRNWVMQGLPTDNFSTENGVLVTRGERWPLMIDPQGQANKWIKKMERDNSLVVVDPKSSDMLRTFEHCIGFGTPVLMEDILLETDPSLDSVLGKQLLKRGASYVIKVGDKEVDFNPNFKFYLTTKLANPHYPPEISTKTTIINFSVKQQGLEDQLLGIFIQIEKEELEIKKNECVTTVAKAKNKLVELEDLILYQLSTVEGSLIDNLEVCNTLTESKIASTEVNEQLAEAAVTEVEIDEAREIFRPVAQRASQLYFVLVDMSKVDPMYQNSLDSYNDLFKMSILNSRVGQQPGVELEPEDRIRELKDWHTLSVYRSTCRGLFSKHKLLFSLLICMKKLMEEAVPPKVEMEDFQFFLRGPQIMDRSTLRENPFPDWLEQSAWEALSELEKLTNFRGFLSSVEQSPRDWKTWYRSPNPETKPLPGDWNNKLDDFQRMVVLRSMRTDRVIHAVSTFITTNVGPEFVQPPVLNLLEVVRDSTPVQPLIFVLSTGADPTNMLRQLSDEQQIEFKPTALGQGQAPYAMSLMDEGKKFGHWVFLANCHLMLSWLPTLEKIIMGFETDNPHPNFRLWLSSTPHPQFPIAILQKGIKMTTEPPTGLKPNLIRLYDNISETKFNKCEKRLPYQRLLFSLCFFHSVLLERRKFLTLGWNIPYEFNDSDIDTAELILCHYLDAYDDVPWEALRYLIAEATYGGRVTDDWDRRLLNVYMSDYFCPDVVQQLNFRLSPLSEYYTPDDGPLKSYKEFVHRLPQSEVPLVFGQHGNAEISSQITNSQTMLEAMVSLQSSAGGAGGASVDDTVAGIASDLQKQIPDLIAIDEIKQLLNDDPSPLNIVLLQESERFNAMLAKIKKALAELQLGIKGLVVMSSELEDVFGALADGKVPAPWLKTYPSVKPLASWAIDLVARIKQLAEWVSQGHPVLLWIGGLTFPTGYLTGLLQLTARKNNQAIDAYSWAFDVLPQPENEIMNSPKEGSYMCGMFLEGAGWSYDNMCLEDPEPMKLVVPMPVIHFKPVERSKRSQKGVYQCPMYLYPVRTGTRERPSFQLVVELKTGPKEPQSRPEYWTKRGTALMLALA